MRIKKNSLEILLLTCVLNYLQKSICSIKKSVINEKGQISCDIKEINRVTDYKIKVDNVRSIKNSDNYTLTRTDFVTAYCTSTNGERYKNN